MGGFVGVFLNRHAFILPSTPPTYPPSTFTTRQANSSIGTTATPSRDSNPPPTKPTSSPLEKKPRLRGIYLLILISSLGTLGYGLALMTNVVTSPHPYPLAPIPSFTHLGADTKINKPSTSPA